MARPRWQMLAAEKRQHEMSKIPEDWLLSTKVVEEAKNRKAITGGYIEGLLDPDSRRITTLESMELLKSLGNGSLSAVQVVSAFSKRAAYAHQLVRGTS